MKQLMSNIRSIIRPSNDALKFECSVTLFEGSQVEISKLYCISVSEDCCQAVHILMGRHILGHLIWVYTVCQSTTWGFQYIKGSLLIC